MTRKIEVLFAEHVETLQMKKLKEFTMVERNEFMAISLRSCPVIINVGGRSLPF